MKKLPEIFWESGIEDQYDTNAYAFRICSFVILFVVMKWRFSYGADLSAACAAAGSSLIFSLYINKTHSIATAIVFAAASILYYFRIGPMLEAMTSMSHLNPIGHPGFGHFLSWLVILAGIHLASFLVCLPFFKGQLPRELHHAALICILTLEHTCIYLLFSLVVLIVCWFLGVAELAFLLAFIVCMILGIREATEEAANISWDYFVARNHVFSFMWLTKQAQQELDMALEEVPDLSTLKENGMLNTEVARGVSLPQRRLAQYYAMCPGVMRNAQQCIRWCKATLEYLEGGSSDAILHNTLNSYRDYYIAHMLLYIVYSSSGKYKSETEAQKHWALFSQSKLSVSDFYAYATSEIIMADVIQMAGKEWSDPNSPFEDHGPLRFFGLPRKKLIRIAQTEPDAYLSLYYYYLAYASFTIDEQEKSELKNQAAAFLMEGVNRNSPACVSFHNSPDYALSLKNA